MLRQLACNSVELEPDAACELAKLTGGLPLALMLVGRALAVESYSGNPHPVISAVIKEMQRADARLTVLPTG